MATLYDSIGQGYRALRRPDPRIARAILAALGDAKSVVNVGAGTGSYEPCDRQVLAIEPSRTMIRQRSVELAPAVTGRAGALPVATDAFDASLAILTLHHWPDPLAGLVELVRVATDRVVLVTWDPAAPGFWLAEYFPGVQAIDRQIFPSIDSIRSILADAEVRPLPIPHDCTDGFLGAFWRRPQAYLDPKVRAAMSTFTKIDASSGIECLRHHLTDGTWRRRFGDLFERRELDLGYRLVVARPGASATTPTGATRQASGDPAPPSVGPPATGTR